jgi:iron complex outermembrane receptor protein
MKKLLLSIASFVFIFHTNAQNSETKDTLNSSKVYELGEVVVTALQTKTSINTENNQQFNRVDVSNSLNILPAISLSNYGGRNEAAVFVRGFDLRQTPVFIDGIPVYLPYDGYVDLNRFTNFDLSQIDIAKGFSSILYGPNTLGGAINLVSMKPKEKLEILASAGVFSGNGYKGNLNIGSNLGKFYVQAGVSRLQKEFFKLSNDFDSVKNENGSERDNSYREDTKGSIKIGFTPNKTNEYSANFIYQHGEKGVPVYAGEDATIKGRYWKYPFWNKKSLYFISKTMLGEKNYVKSKIFFDKFDNQIDSYDDDTYTTQTKPYAFQSVYNDKTIGASLEFGTEIIEMNNLKMALHFKNDQHQQYNIGETPANFTDNTISIGVEDNFKISEKITFVPGFSYNVRKSLLAEDYNAKKDSISNFPANTNDAVNAQIASFYNINKTQQLSFTFARKTRFATMKDRYSYKSGKAIPNPDLKAENALNFELAYNGIIREKLSLKPALFYSRIADIIQQVDNVEPGISQMQNTGIAEFFGGELSANYKIDKKLTMGANYTYIERKNITNSEILFTDVPKHKVFASAIYKPIERIEITLSEEFNSERFSTSYGNIAPAFALTNARISAKVWKYLFVECGVNNIFDKNYSLSEGYAEERRNIFASITFKRH